MIPGDFLDREVNIAEAQVRQYLLDHGLCNRRAVEIEAAGAEPGEG